MLLFVIIIAVAGGDVVAILLLLLFLNFHANVENDLFVAVVAIDDDDVVDEIVDKAKFENRLDSKPTHLLLLEGFIIFFVKVQLLVRVYGIPCLLFKLSLCLMLLCFLLLPLFLLLCCRTVSRCAVVVVSKKASCRASGRQLRMRKVVLC